MRLAYAILAGLVGVLFAVPTAAAPCQSRPCAAQAVVAAAPVVAITPAVLPLYGAGYVGTTSDDETKELLRQLLTELQAMHAEIKALKAAPTGFAKPADQVDVFAVLRANCVSCHSGQKPKGQFSLVTDAGKFRELSPPEIRSVLGRLEGKGGAKMPPADKPSLKPTELASIKAAFADGPPAIPESKK